MYSKNYLAHYGILGMKWGIRRFQPYSVRGRKSGKGGKEIGEAKQSGPSHENLIKSTNADEVYKYRDRLSDKELRDRVNRIQTEKQLKDLTSIKRGKTFSKKVLEKVQEKSAEAMAVAIVAAGTLYVKNNYAYLSKALLFKGFT